MQKMAQHRRSNTTGTESVVSLHLKEIGHSFEGNNIHMLDREDRWFERGVEEVICAKMENTFLNRS